MQKLKGKIFKEVCGRSGWNFFLCRTVCYQKKHHGQNFSIALLVTRVMGLHRTVSKNGFFCKNTCGEGLKQEMEISPLSFLWHLMLSSALFFSHYQLTFPLYFGYFFYCFVTSVSLWFLLPQDCSLQMDICTILLNGLSLSPLTFLFKLLITPCLSPLFFL